MNRPLCRNHQYQILGLIVFALFWLSACGGGSGADGNPPAATVTGQALLGPLCGASVDVFRYDDLDNSIHTTTTTDAATLSAAGQFEIPEALLDDESLYIIKISGGMDIDADDDGVVDASPTENQGTLHLAATGSQMKAGGFKANILTDIVYHKIAYLFLAKYPLETILAEMEQYARILLKSDVNGTGAIDGDDLLAWNPANDMARTTRSRSFLMDCTAAVHAKSTYSDALSHIYKGIVASVDTLGNAVDLALDENHLFVASLAAGLQI